MQPRQTRRVFGALTLGIVKVRRNGDNYTIQLACQGFSCPRRQCFEDVRRNAHRVQQPRRRFNHRQAIFAGLELIRQMRIALLDISQRAPHQAFNRTNGVGGVERCVSTRVITHRMPLLLIVNNRWQQVTAFMVS
ncbi:hypothetical protein ExPCM12_00689 [Escherichia coli]|nr:hypothetical protein ExPCM12_00689 [Escherichia coli]